jgi:hypothetical protein
VVGKVKYIQDYKNGPKHEIRVGQWIYYGCEDTLYVNRLENYDRKGRLHGKSMGYTCDSVLWIKGTYNHGYRVGLFQIFNSEGSIHQEFYYAKMPDSLKNSPGFGGEYGSTSGYMIWSKEYDENGNVIEEWHQ